MAKILVVDDESDICDILKFNLENAGHTVETACSAEEAMKQKLSTYSLFLLDVMMDNISGYELAEQIRSMQETATTPIIFITAKSGERDILKGFNAGADDYINKPFRISEVIARVNAILRRVHHSVPEDTFVFENLVLDPDSKRAMIDGNDIGLTKKEFEVLFLLMQKPGKVYSRDDILAKVWPGDVNVLERSIDVSIARLRKKMGEYSSHIVSRSGYGYCFVKQIQE
ncbi:MAG: response regulator transcription factor [Bacteroidaceae bacterium]|nr:response regulator transcription factor [Bacteroidales bacterium]MBQ2878040.1 response regulator transcription factor [Bacteroidaceae bacterium]MBQ3622112.1 response regulator transcription factor [Bacteroidaceae bacterium]MBR7135165.1 response regulator transcription factor [Bacteroidaceae bacterium]